MIFFPMMRTIRLLILGVTITSLGVGCHADQTTRSPTRPMGMPSLDAAGVRKEAREHLDRLGVDPVAHARLQTRLDVVLADPHVRARMDELGVQAVGSFRLGEGGAVVKFAKGSGTVDFPAGRSVVPFDIEAYSVGAQIGGSAQQGIILFMGLPRESAVGGSYSGKRVRAAAVTEGTREASVFAHEVYGHLAYMIGISQGLTADAGIASLTLGLHD